MLQKKKADFCFMQKPAQFTGSRLTSPLRTGLQGAGLSLRVAVNRLSWSEMVPHATHVLGHAVGGLARGLRAVQRHLLEHAVWRPYAPFEVRHGPRG